MIPVNIDLQGISDDEVMGGEKKEESKVGEYSKLNSKQKLSLAKDGDIVYGGDEKFKKIRDNTWQSMLGSEKIFNDEQLSRRIGGFSDFKIESKKEKYYIRDGKRISQSELLGKIKSDQENFRKEEKQNDWDLRDKELQSEKIKSQRFRVKNGDVSSTIYIIPGDDGFFRVKSLKTKDQDDNMGKREVTTKNFPNSKYEEFIDDLNKRGGIKLEDDDYLFKKIKEVNHKLTLTPLSILRNLKSISIDINGNQHNEITLSESNIKYENGNWRIGFYTKASIRNSLTKFLEKKFKPYNISLIDKGKGYYDLILKNK